MPSHGLIARNTRGSSIRWVTPPAASARNQISVMGPKSCATLAVPLDCTLNSPTRMASVIGRTAYSSCGAISFRPSTADSTEMAGVMTASP